MQAQLLDRATGNVTVLQLPPDMAITNGGTNYKNGTVSEQSAHHCLERIVYHQFLRAMRLPLAAAASAMAVTACTAVPCVTIPICNSVPVNKVLMALSGKGSDAPAGLAVLDPATGSASFLLNNW